MVRSKGGVPMSSNETSAADQDKYRGAKFLLLLMVHGADKTLDALHAEDSESVLNELDSTIQRNRAGVSVKRSVETA